MGENTGPREEDPQFLDKYAFNICRRAYDHGVPYENTTGITLRVSGVHHWPADGSLEAKDHTSPPLVPTAEEVSPRSGQKGIECIWVGMAASLHNLAKRKRDDNGHFSIISSNDGGEESRPIKRARKSGSVAELHEATMADISAFDSSALRVVRKKGAKANTYYALTTLDQHTNLCSAHSISSDDVFFFRLFRDDHATSKSARRNASHRKTSMAAEIPLSTSALCLPAQQVTQSIQALDSEASLADIGTGKHAPTQEGDGANDTFAPPHSVAKGVERSSIGDGLEITLGVLENVIADDHTECHGNQLPPTNQCSESNFYEEGQESGRASSMSQLSSIDSDEEAREPFSDYEYDEALFEPISTPSSQFHAAMDSKTGPQTVDGISLENSDMNEALMNPITVSPAAIDTVNEEKGDIGMPFADIEGNPATEQAKLSSRVVDHITELLAGIHKRGDLEVLHQVSCLLKCLDKTEIPANTSALGISLHIPRKVYERDCRQKLEELLGLFPDLEDEADLDENKLGWILKGLQETGTSIEYAMIKPYIKAFCLELRAACRLGLQDNPYKLSRRLLVDITCAARDDAEASIQETEAHHRTKTGNRKEGEHGKIWTATRWPGSHRVQDM